MARKRKAGDGGIHLRKDGRWEGRYVIGYDDKGYPQTKNVLAKTKRECAEKLEALKAELGGIKSDKVKPEMRFGDWMVYWFENHAKPKVRPSTQKNYWDRIRLHINPELGHIPLNKLTQNDLQQFYGRLKKNGRKAHTDKYGNGLSDRMVRMCHATCRSALEKAKLDGLIRTNPAIGCKLPPKKAREMQVLDRDELQRFLIQAKVEGYYELFLLELAGCKHVRFHDLRHTFATLALQGGMDIKTLSAMLGHVSAATTLDIYTHITDDMQRQAAANIDRGIGKAAPPESSFESGQKADPGQSEKPGMTDFQPVPRKQRRPGTGCITQKSPNLWEGRYSPTWIDGKKHARNVYAHTREECEEKLKVLIIEMKTELAELKRQKAEGTLPPQEPETGKKNGRKKAEKSKKKSE